MIDKTEWTPELTEKAFNLYRQGKTWAEISKELSKYSPNLTNDRVRMKIKRMLKRPTEEPYTVIPPGEKAKGTANELMVKCDNVLVCSDFHVPGESSPWIGKLISYARDNGIDTLVVAGDFWNHDSVSRWQVKDPAMTLKTEIKRGKEVVKRLKQTFKHIYFVCGNHDARLPKALNFSLNFTDWMDALFGDSVVATDYDFLILESGKKKFRVCHPDFYSKSKAVSALELAHRLQENIIVGHQHYLSMSTNTTGRYLCISSGCMCSKNEFYYKNSATTAFPDWENGFIHVLEGKVRLIADFTF